MDALISKFTKKKRGNLLSDPSPSPTGGDRILSGGFSSGSVGGGAAGGSSGSHGQQRPPNGSQDSVASPPPANMPSFSSLLATPSPTAAEGATRERNASMSPPALTPEGAPATAAAGGTQQPLRRNPSEAMRAPHAVHAYTYQPSAYSVVGGDGAIGGLDWSVDDNGSDTHSGALDTAVEEDEAELPQPQSYDLPSSNEASPEAIAVSSVSLPAFGGAPPGRSRRQSQQQQQQQLLLEEAAKETAAQRALLIPTLGQIDQLTDAQEAALALMQRQHLAAATSAAAIAAPADSGNQNSVSSHSSSITPEAPIVLSASPASSVTHHSRHVSTGGSLGIGSLLQQNSLGSAATAATLSSSRRSSFSHNGATLQLPAVNEGGSRSRSRSHSYTDLSAVTGPASAAAAAASVSSLAAAPAALPNTPGAHTALVLASTNPAVIASSISDTISPQPPSLQSAPPVLTAQRSVSGTALLALSSGGSSSGVSVASSSSGPPLPSSRSYNATMPSSSSTASPARLPNSSTFVRPTPPPLVHAGGANAAMMYIGRAAVDEVKSLVDNKLSSGHLTGETSPRGHYPNSNSFSSGPNAAAASGGVPSEKSSGGLLGSKDRSPGYLAYMTAIHEATAARAREQAAAKAAQAERERILALPLANPSTATHPSGFAGTPFGLVPPSTLAPQANMPSTLAIPPTPGVSVSPPARSGVQPPSSTVPATTSAAASSSAGVAPSPSVPVPPLPPRTHIRHRYSVSGRYGSRRGSATAGATTSSSSSNTSSSDGGSSNTGLDVSQEPRLGTNGRADFIPLQPVVHLWFTTYLLVYLVLHLWLSSLLALLLPVGALFALAAVERRFGHGMRAKTKAADVARHAALAEAKAQAAAAAAQHITPLEAVVDHSIGASIDDTPSGPLRARSLARGNDVEATSPRVVVPGPPSAAPLAAHA